MSSEIETKAKIDNINNVSLWLSEHANFQRSVYQEDTLYDFIPSSFVIDPTTLRSDEFMRIRCTNHEDLLTHKIIRRDQNKNFLCCDEYESVIQPQNIEKIKKILAPFNILSITDKDCKNAKSLENLLKVGQFKELIKIKKERKEYTLGEFNIALDHVSNLGDFIEVESIQRTSDEKLIKIIKNKELKLLQDIKICSNNIVKKGYLDLIMEKKNGRYF